MKRIVAVLLVLCSYALGSGFRPVHADHGMVASVHAEASQVGVDIMRAGGNAVDAAVATGFALAVVYPQAGNIGGGGFMLFRTASGEVHFLDYREKAPARATATMYQDEKGNIIPNLSIDGYKVHRRAGLGRRTGLRAAPLGQAAAGARDGSGHPPRARRLRAHLRRRLQPARRKARALRRVAPRLST
jgi:hypothetical protein